MIELGEQDKVTIELGEQDTVTIELGEQDTVTIELGEQDKVMIELGEQDKVTIELREQDNVEKRLVLKGECIFILPVFLPPELMQAWVTLSFIKSTIMATN